MHNNLMHCKLMRISHFSKKNFKATPQGGPKPLKGPRRGLLPPPRPKNLIWAASFFEKN